jgi:hypothetical protein
VPIVEHSTDELIKLGNIPPGELGSVLVTQVDSIQRLLVAEVGSSGGDLLWVRRSSFTLLTVPTGSSGQWSVRQTAFFHQYPSLSAEPKSQAFLSAHR